MAPDAARLEAMIAPVEMLPLVLWPETCDVALDTSFVIAALAAVTAVDAFKFTQFTFPE
jgi:hypothetical protein